MARGTENEQSESEASESSKWESQCESSDLGDEQEEERPKDTSEDGECQKRYCEAFEEEGEDEEESDEQECSSEEEEKQVGIALALPRRGTRGHRQASLEGETAKQDQTFWSHDTWEEEQDGDYCCSEGEEIYKDTIDSDFDAKSSESEEDKPGEPDEHERKKRKINRAYVDPRKKTLRNDARRGVRVQKKTKESPPARGKSAAAQERRPIVQISQAEHMRRAIETEKENAKSLQALQAWEEERKQYLEYKKLTYKGHYEIYISWASDRLITPEGGLRDSTEENTAEGKKLDKSKASNAGKAVEQTAPDKRLATSGKGSENSSTENKSVPNLANPKGIKEATNPDQEEELTADELLMLTASTIPDLYPTTRFRKKTYYCYDKSTNEATTVIGGGKSEAKINENSPGILKQLQGSKTKHMCLVTGLPAKYKDPLTGCYYHDMNAFKIIRQTYHFHLRNTGLSTNNTAS